jgi:hypothetical protein
MNAWETLKEYIEDWVMPRLEKNIAQPLQDGVTEAAAENAAKDAVIEAAEKLMETFEMYKPNDGITSELWWRPNPSKTMAERDEWLTALAAKLAELDKVTKAGER